MVAKVGPSEPSEGQRWDTRVWAPEWNLSPPNSILGPGPSLDHVIEFSKGFVMSKDKDTLMKLSLGRLAIEHTKALGVVVLASHRAVMAKQEDLVHEVEWLKKRLQEEVAEKDTLKVRLDSSVAELESVRAEMATLRATADSTQQQLKTLESEVAAKLEEAEAKRQSEVEDLVQHFGREMSASQRLWKDNFLGSVKFLQRVQLYIVTVLTAGLEIEAHQLERFLCGKGMEVNRDGYEANLSDQCSVEMDQPSSYEPALFESALESEVDVPSSSGAVEAVE
ncbi:hypothetical protein Ancab_039939 [Ancistrocladus abbreviatus]